jgi:hypothetical protein
MKNQMLAFLTFILFASHSVAQNTSTTLVPEIKTVSSQGIRVGFTRSILDAQINFSMDSLSTEYSRKIDESLGLSVGYVHLPIQSLGWAASGSFFQMKNNGQEAAQMIRLDGNLAYTFNQYFHIKGGLNTSEFIKGNLLTQMSADLSGQAGVGFQINKNFGFDVGYVEIHQSGTLNTSLGDMDMKYKFSGIEMGFNGTF